MKSNDPKTYLVVVLATDIDGFAQVKEQDEALAERWLAIHENFVKESSDLYKGRILKRSGSSFFIRFDYSTRALDSARYLHRIHQLYNHDNSVQSPLVIRTVLHLGEIRLEGDHYFGKGIETAEKILPHAEPDEICITETLYKVLRKQVKIAVDRRTQNYLGSDPEETELIHFRPSITMKKRGIFSWFTRWFQPHNSR